MKILLAGATGLVGNALTKALLKEGHTLSMLSRSKKENTPNMNYYIWDPSKSAIDHSAFDEADAIINLSGAGVADKRWTEAYKKDILYSRVLSTRLLVQKLASIQHQVKIFINASAIGYYGFDTGDTLVDENAPAGIDFLADVVKKWEHEAFEAEKLGIRTITIRTGIVLSNKGGALPQMSLPAKYWLGAALGSGKQYLSWIDMDDLVGIFLFGLKNESVRGSINAVAPNPVTNEEFNIALAKQYGTKIILPNLPSFILKLLLGEFSSAILGGNKVSSGKITEKGFVFSFNDLPESLENQKEA